MSGPQLGVVSVERSYCECDAKELESRLGKCRLTKANRSVFIVLNVYPRKLSCGVEVCGLYCFMSFALTSAAAVAVLRG